MRRRRALLRREGEVRVARRSAGQVVRFWHSEHVGRDECLSGCGGVEILSLDNNQQALQEARFATKHGPRSRSCSATSRACETPCLTSLRLHFTRNNYRTIESYAPLHCPHIHSRDCCRAQQILPPRHWCAGSVSFHPTRYLGSVVSRVENDKLLDADCPWTTLPADITVLAGRTLSVA